MNFANNFEVSLPPEQAWRLLMDVQAIMPCMPGAEIAEVVDEKNFKVKVAVRLGPVALVFLCDVAFVDVDDSARVAKAKASGADAKGRGTAQAAIDFRCQPSEKGSQIFIKTDLSLSGAVAQYGRGVGLIQNVANQIVSQFSRNLEARISQLKEHGAIGETLDEEQQPQAGAAGERSSAPSLLVKPAPSPATGANSLADYAQGFREGYSAGFSAGHVAGLEAANELAGYKRTTLAPAGKGKSVPPPFPPARPIGGVSLVCSSLWATMRGWFSRNSA
ncbi:SRPBCC family protein [Paraburkholderia sediminicola]|uniref:SRPBCC family protein n=1 Tax=Paraburkholderia sediminicola TaxID=458836 RepID=UPI0038BD5781